jgi:Tfp pilus assembly protein PilO
VEKYIEHYRKLTPQLKILILIVLCALSAAYSWYESVEPAFAAHQMVVEEMAQLDGEVESLNKAGQNIVAVESELRKADEEIALLLDLLPSDPEIDRVLNYFATASKETGVELQEFVPEDAAKKKEVDAAAAQATPPVAPKPPEKAPVVPPPPTAADEVTRTLVTVKLTGSFSQITAFLDRVLGLPRVLRVASFNYNAPEGSDAPKEPGSSVGGNEGGTEAAGGPRLSANVVFEAFSQKGLVEPAQSQVPAPPAGAPPAGTLPPPELSSVPNAAGIGAPASEDPSLSAKPLPLEAPGE